RSEVQTPPSPEPSSTPAIRNVGFDSTEPAITSPTHQDASTIISVRVGPISSTRKPQPKLATTAATVRASSTRLASPLVKPIAFTANVDMTTMTVLTGSV